MNDEPTPMQERTGKGRTIDASKFSKKDLDRLNANIQKGNADECWLWRGSVNDKGYGRFRVGNRLLSPSRIILAISLGSLPAEKLACHKCDNPRCCNPAHLFAGTYTENNIDCVNKGRAKGNPRPSASFRNGNIPLTAKLNPAKVLKIREIGNSIPASKIAQMFAVSEVTIRKILTFKIWTTNLN